MAVRSDITVDFELSPRIATVANTSDQVTVQDLVDTLRTIEGRSASMDDGKLLDAAGKEDLGGGTQVGVTVTLQNVQVEFAPDLSPKEAGTATSADPGGTTLVDTAATFQTNLVARGDVVVNFDDRSMASVLSVDSETQLTVRPLTGGTANDWGAGDVYRVYETRQTEIVGGNIVALDSGGGDIRAVFPSPMTQATVEKSSSATLTDQSTIAALLATIEAILVGRYETDPVAGVARVYDLSNNVIFEAPIYEDAAGTTVYNVNSAKIERRDRFVAP